jgi:hypothetical protein
MTQNLRPAGCTESDTLMLTRTKPPDIQMECYTDPALQVEGGTPANLEARVEELSRLVLTLQDQLSRQNDEMELLRMQLRKEQNQPRASGHPPNKRTRTARERTTSLESGEIISDTASMPEQVQDEPRPEAKETMQPATDDNQVVTIGLLRQILHEVLQPQTKEYTPAKAKTRIQHQGPKSYANVAAIPPVVTTRPRRVTKASTTIFQERKEAAEFSRLHFNTPRANYKNLNSSKEVTQAIRGALKSAGIASKVPLFSKIGDSVLELYVPKCEVENVTQIMESKKVKQLTNFDLLATPKISTVPQKAMENMLVKRLTFLYRIAKFQKLKECILAGVPEELRQTIKDQAAAPGGDVDVVFGDVHSPPSQTDIPFH